MRQHEQRCAIAAETQRGRLCIARALAAQPEVLLLDEPCSALDPRSTANIEQLIVELRQDLAVVIVTHNLQQAYRVADSVAQCGHALVAQTPVANGAPAADTAVLEQPRGPS